MKKWSAGIISHARNVQSSVGGMLRLQRGAEGYPANANRLHKSENVQKVLMIELSDDAWRRFYKREARAQSNFNRQIQSAHSPSEDYFQFDLRAPWEQIEALDQARKRASLKYFGSLVFFWLREPTLRQLPVDELRRIVNTFLVVIRKGVLDNKWPNPSLPASNQEERKQREFDQALIEWLEVQKPWREYEVRIISELPRQPVPDYSAGEAATPLMYSANWALENLPPKARKVLKAGLLEIHGSHLDSKTGYVECCRNAYDLIASEFDRAKLLSQEALQRTIPEMIADASAGAGWAAESLGRTTPTAIFNVPFGSQFYPPWRLESFLESLEGRMTWWSSRMLKIPTLDRRGRPGRPPRSKRHKTIAYIVESVGSDWSTDPAKLLQVAEQMDDKGIPLDRRSLRDGVESWKDKHDDDRTNFVKVIQYALKKGKI